MFSRTRRTKFFAKSSLLRLVADDAVSTGRRILSTGLALQISKWNRKKAFSLLASLPGIFGRKEADLWNLGIFADFLTRKCRGYPDGKKEISVTYGLAFFVWSHRLVIVEVCEQYSKPKCLSISLDAETFLVISVISDPEIRKILVMGMFGNKKNPRSILVHDLLSTEIRILCLKLAK